MPAPTDSRYRFRPRLVRGVAVLALGLGALTACGSDEPDATAASPSSASSSSSSTSSASSSAPASGGSAETRTLTATETNFAIKLSDENLSAGTYEVTAVNDGEATHDLVVERGGSDIAGTGDSFSPGGSATFTVTLEPGQYVFYCSVGNHRAMGMELTVEVT